MKFISKIAAMMVLTTTALASEPTYLVTPDANQSKANLLKCLSELKSLGYNHSSLAWIESMTIVTVDPLIIGVFVTEEGAEQIRNLQCVSSVEENGEAHTQPGLGRSNF